MKKKAVILLSAIAFMASPLVKAQTPAPPGNYTLDKESDYAGYESKVKEYVAWYEKAPVDKDEDLHKQIAAFLVKWISGAPNVSVAIGDVAKPLVDQKDYKYNGDLLIVYMGAIAVYELNNPNDKDEAKIEQAGVEGVLEFFNNNQSQLKGSDAVKKYKKLKDKGELEKWIKDNMAKTGK